MISTYLSSYSVPSLVRAHVSTTVSTYLSTYLSCQDEDKDEVPSGDVVDVFDVAGSSDPRSPITAWRPSPAAGLLPRGGAQW